ncbi:LPS-assembly protein LptD @ Organic solvent tolerance protein precursor [hydrothermal vent metagenome]|uniref:LPS-assembly protein LptD @ Organic solvent tolerance protein n=1 Tax=hydrothermal vent metagenome TaxID=652676 RepID=A0A3B0V6L0_9ZZZZ
MNKLIIIVICNICLAANSVATCSSSVIAEEGTAICGNNSQSEFTTIDALNFIPTEDGILRVGGDVCISMGKQRVTTKELHYDDNQQTITIESPLVYSDENQTIKAQNAKIDMSKETASMSKVSYLLKDSQANGEAKLLTTDKKTSYLTGLTYSTCPADNRQWYIKAGSADLDQQKQVGTFRKMTLRFKGVPLLYFPYAKMPLSNQRKSGFLIPDVKNSSNNGFDIALPYYINIAENMDATLTPRYLSKRGVMLGAEFRYMGTNYTGEIYADYLPSDKIDKIDRGYAEFKHRQSFNSNWSLNSRLNNVSDRQYFEDFGNNIYATSQSYLYSFLNINGFGDNWQFKGQLNDYQIISEAIPLNRQPYQSLPRLEYSWFNNNYMTTLNYGLDSSWVNLFRESSINTYRLDVTPYIAKTFQNSHSKFTPKLAYRYTNWDYSGTPHPLITDLDSNRSLPIVSLDYTVNFEKQFTDGSFSSLEPRLFYLYVPYQDQQNIPLFNTNNLTFGTGLLYQSNSFSGVDRQADANQISVGVSQRHFDTTGNEKWNITLGQIAYFSDRRVQLDDSVETRDTSPIITEFNYFYRNWKATMSVHWDTEIDKSERALVKFQHKGENNSLFNFAYRFRRGKIEQLDSSVVLPIGTNNRFIARWNYSIQERATIEAIAGFEHKSCCWAARIVARRYIFNEEGDVNNGIFFELQLNGLGAIGRKPRRLLKQSILGYSEEF